MAREIHYSSDGKKWFRTEWEGQCEDEDIFCGLRCQGVSNHGDIHWAYAPNGDFCYWVNDSDPECMEEDIASGSTPADHKEWVHPSEMHDKYYRSYNKTVEVTDPEEIARIEKGDVPNGVSIERPVPTEDMEKLKKFMPKRHK